MYDSRAHPPSEKPGPLAGVRVVEVGVWHAGPGATAILSDLGADVIKIETLAGDPERIAGGVGPLRNAAAGLGKENWTILYEISNRGKRGICLDLTVKESQDLLYRLLQDVDVFATNLRSPAQVRLGIDYQTLHERFPKLIFSDVSGFGRRGPVAHMGGFDGAGQAISGMMYAGGTPEPSYLQVILLDQITAITSSHGVLSALVQRDRTGVGQYVGTSLYASAVSFLYANVFATSLIGKELDLSWDRKREPALRTTYQTKDGEWLFAAHSPEEKYWARFIEALGVPELIEDPRFLTPQLRYTNRPALFDIFDPIFASRTLAEWLDRFSGLDLIFMPIQRFMDVLEDEQALANGIITSFELPGVGEVKIPGYPIEFSEATAGTTRPAPGLGEHTHEVLAELGLTDEEIDRLRAAGAIR